MYAGNVELTIMAKTNVVFTRKEGRALKKTQLYMYTGYLIFPSNWFKRNVTVGLLEIVI
jgi:hypothetical protein